MMTTTTQAIEIPALKSSEKVEAWGKQYLAATALLKPEQQLSLFPVYAGKNASEGEKTMIEIAMGQGDIKKALDEFEILRDGEPHKLMLVDRYYKMEPLGNDLKPFFFELLRVGKKAKISPYMIMLRFLSLCPRGKKLFDDNKASINEEMEEAQVVELYKKIAPKLDVSNTSKDFTPCHIKEEIHTTFLADEGEMPQWAKRISESVEDMRRSMESQSLIAEEEKQVESENEVWYTNSNSNKSTRKVPKSPIICRSCNKKGHKAAECFTKCYQCGGSGHSSKVCPTTKSRGNATDRAGLRNTHSA